MPAYPVFMCSLPTAGQNKENFWHRLRFNRRTQLWVAAGVTIPTIYYYSHIETVPISGRLLVVHYSGCLFPRCLLCAGWYP